MDLSNSGADMPSIEPVLLVLAAVAAMAIGTWLARRQGISLRYPLATALLVGLGSARLSFVLVYQEMYARAPWTVLDLRDGGFNYIVGAAGAVIMTILLAIRRRTWRMPLLATLLSGAALWGAMTAMLSFQEKNTPLPDVVLSDLSGKPVSLASFGSKPLVVNLWATWCPPCRREMPILSAAQRENRDVVFVFANQGESVEKISAYIRSEGLGLDNVLIDTTGILARQLGSAGLSTTFYFDAKRRLFATTIGEVSSPALTEQLRLLREGI